MKEKSVIQKVVDLLEENGFHVFEAKEDPGDLFTSRISNKGVIKLLITPLSNEAKK